MKNRPLQFTSVLIITAFLLLAFINMNEEKPRQNEGNTAIVGVANIIENQDGSVDFTFHEKQAIFKLPKDNKNKDAFIRIAREAKDKQEPVKMIYTGSDKLLQLIVPDEKEKAAYLLDRRNDLFDLDPTRVVNLNKIDTAKFNFTENQIWKAFARCTKIVPNYSEAKKIFDFCAAQQCSANPTQITPCIPFQYVKDGCFARAHKMRSIIENKFKYCSEKVYSFRFYLGVNAAKWGGCCINWWYHVAPLIRVNGKRGTICYVIDPSMFNHPVTLSTWLTAQENPSCITGEGTTSYAIQPSTTYAPTYNTNHTISSTYQTDPNYVRTNADLVFYNNQGPSCTQ